MKSTPSPIPLAEFPDPRRWWAMLGIGLGVLMVSLDVSIVNLTLPTLVDVFHTTFPTVQWVVLSYLMVLTSLVLGAARLGDMFGRKPMYLGGMALFTASSLACGLAPGVGYLIAFRVLQGVGAVFMTGLGAAIVTEVFPASERGRALGIIGSVVASGIALGPSVGGLLIGVSGWRAIFLVNVPIGIGALFIVTRLVPAPKRGPPGQRFDFAGAALAALALIAFALGMTVGQHEGFRSPAAMTLLAGAAAGVAIFLAVESHARQPMLDLKLFRNVPFSLGLLTAALVFVTLAGNSIIMPFFLELVLGLPTWQAGLLLAVAPVMGGIVAPISGALSDRFGSRPISLLGLSFMLVGCLAISTFHAGLTVPGVIARLAPFGIGVGMFQSPNNSAVLGAAPRERLGVAAALLSLARSLGQTIGVPVMGALFAATAAGAAGITSAVAIGSTPPDALVAAVRGTYRIAALVLLAAIILVAVLWKWERNKVGPSSAAKAPRQ